MAEHNRFEALTIAEKGLWLYLGVLYLGATVEYTESNKLVPAIEGRSSLARMGLQVHVTAGFGDNGFCGEWTLGLQSSTHCASTLECVCVRSATHRSSACPPNTQASINNSAARDRATSGAN